jgi:hypothetical protein
VLKKKRFGKFEENKNIFFVQRLNDLYLCENNLSREKETSPLKVI